MSSRSTEPFVDMIEAASFLKKDRSWLYNNQARLGVPRYMVGRHYRYRISELAAWVERQAVSQ